MSNQNMFLPRLRSRYRRLKADFVAVIQSHPTKGWFMRIGNS